MGPEPLLFGSLDPSGRFRLIGFRVKVFGLRVEGIYGLGCSVCLAAALQLCCKGPQYVNIIYSQTKTDYDHYEDPRDQLHRMEVVVRICRRALKGLGFAGCA